MVLNSCFLFEFAGTFLGWAAAAAAGLGAGVWGLGAVISISVEAWRGGGTPSGTISRQYGQNAPVGCRRARVKSRTRLKNSLSQIQAEWKENCHKPLNLRSFI